MYSLRAYKMRSTLYYSKRWWKPGPKLSAEIKLRLQSIKFLNNCRSNRATSVPNFTLLDETTRFWWLPKMDKIPLSRNEIDVAVQQASSERDSTPARWTWGDIEVSGSDRSKPPAIGRTQVAKATKRWVRIAHVRTAREPSRTDGTAGRTHESAQSKCLCELLNIGFFASAHVYFRS